MRKFIKYLLWLTFFSPIYLIFHSCEDSLGYDPNVDVTKIIKDTVKIDPNDPQTKFINIDRLEVVFKEFYQVGRLLKDERWDFNITFQKILIDTSTKFPRLWLEIDFLSNKTDNDCRHRHDRVLNYSIKLAAEIYTETIYNLNDKNKERRWSMIMMRDMRRGGGTNFIIPGGESRSQIILDEINFRAGYFNFSISNDFSKYPYLSTRYFRGNIKLIFKK